MTNRTISESTLFLLADVLSAHEVAENPEITERVFKTVKAFRRGLMSEETLCDGLQTQMNLAKTGHDLDLQLFPVYFELVNGTVYKTAIPAHSNGGAENKVLDLLPGMVRRCLAFATDGHDSDVAFDLYPSARWIDCMEVASLKYCEIETDTFDD